jgi:hypothetical protein
MYKEHSKFIQPKDEEVKVWRYMDFTKFLSLIDSRQLFFTRADKFNDPFEGSYPKPNITKRDALLTEFLDDQSKKDIDSLSMYLSKTNQSVRKCTAINCWHMNNHESAAMWSLYLKSDEGVAIQSTYSKLKNSLVDDKRIYLGKIQYIDYDKEHIEGRNNLIAPFMYKRKSFEHEQEIRALIFQWPDHTDFSQSTIEQGLKIEVNIQQLIERVYVAPNTPDWFFDLIKSVITRYGYDFEVTRSKLNERPLF